MVNRNRDNCVFESKKSFERKTSLIWMCLGRLFCRMKETPFSIVERRFLAMKRASLHIEETPPLFTNNGLHSPLHSERGRGRGCRGDVVRLVVAESEAFPPYLNVRFPS